MSFPPEAIYEVTHLETPRQGIQPSPKTGTWSWVHIVDQEATIYLPLWFLQSPKSKENKHMFPWDVTGTHGEASP